MTRSQKSAQAINESIHNHNRQQGTVMWAAYCIDCDKIIAFDKSLDFINYLVNRHLKMPQTIEDRVIIGKLYDVQGPITDERLSEIAKKLDV